ncbi:hypothetical protein GCM10012280_45160 [Wenjunlia tyrosinilytica]|uniref:Uncharacterized protein n=1 Tax=Wenjunlia tyrosinilytica TaxID=1544741 RepID=A0A918E0H0_9ACTN|nr:hypothetical protein GCM10012280_45160 [Wenjunlia tyrosinilytica]
MDRGPERGARDAEFPAALPLRRDGAADLQRLDQVAQMLPDAFALGRRLSATATLRYCPLVI